MHDYYLVFVSDGTATTSQAAHDATLANIDQFFGQVATADAIAAAWAATGRGRARSPPAGEVGTGPALIAGMSELIGQLLFGLAIGSIYSLVAIGFQHDLPGDRPPALRPPGPHDDGRHDRLHAGDPDGAPDALYCSSSRDSPSPCSRT